MHIARAFKHDYGYIQRVICLYSNRNVVLGCFHMTMFCNHLPHVVSPSAVCSFSNQSLFAQHFLGKCSETALLSMRLESCRFSRAFLSPLPPYSHLLLTTLQFHFFRSILIFFFSYSSDSKLLVDRGSGTIALKWM